MFGFTNVLIDHCNALDECMTLYHIIRLPSFKAGLHSTGWRPHMPWFLCHLWNHHLGAREASTALNYTGHGFPVTYL